MECVSIWLTILAACHWPKHLACFPQTCDFTSMNINLRNLNSECPCILFLERNPGNLIVRHWKRKQCFMLPLGSSRNPKASYCIPRNQNTMECQRIQWNIHSVSTFQLLQFFSSKQPYPERSHSILDKAAPSVPKRCHPTPSPIQFHPNSFNKRQAILL